MNDTIEIASVGIAKLNNGETVNTTDTTTITTKTTIKLLEYYDNDTRQIFKRYNTIGIVDKDGITKYIKHGKCDIYDKTGKVVYTAWYSHGNLVNIIESID